MGASGGNAPTGLTQREARTIFLRAPYSDWSALALGQKTEFRAKPRGSFKLRTPTPVVLYAVSSGGHRREKLMVLVQQREERLMEVGVSAQALAAEGFETYEEFRHYWRSRTRRPYQALDKVIVYRLRAFTENDRSILGATLLDRLYGEYA